MKKSSEKTSEKVYKFKENCNFVLPEIDITNVKKVLIFGNVEGIFGYPDDLDLYFNINCAKRFNLFWELISKYDTIDKIDVIGPKSVGEYFNKIISYILKNYPCKNKYNIRKRYRIYTVKDNKEYFDFMDKIEEKNEKYDLVIMNPPYLGENRNEYNEHLKFLNKAISVSNVVISVEPIMFLFKSYDRKSPEYTEKEILSTVEKYGVEVNEIDGNEVFDAAFGNKLGILKFDMTRKFSIIVDGKIYESYNDITKFSHDDLLSDFNYIISSLYKDDNVYNHWRAIDKRYPKLVEQRERDSNSNMWFVNVAAIRGHKGTDDMFTIVPKDRVPESGDRNFNYYINFNTKEDAINFLNYAKTDFASCCIYLFKNDINLGTALHYVPWFDFSDPHFSKSPKEIDDYLFKKFNISAEIRNHIAEILPDYYNIR